MSASGRRSRSPLWQLRRFGDGLRPLRVMEPTLSWHRWQEQSVEEVAREVGVQRQVSRLALPFRAEKQFFKLVQLFRQCGRTALQCILERFR